CPTMAVSPLKCSQTLTAYIVQVATGDASRGTVEYSSIFAIGVLLFVMTLGLNMFSQRFVRRFRQAY
ncbi:MAG: phosphate ABC transporter permease subunit PstC, partial [Actinomycetota bacterium]